MKNESLTVLTLLTVELVRLKLSLKERKVIKKYLNDAKKQYKKLFGEDYEPF